MVRNTRNTTIPSVAPVADILITEPEFDDDEDEDSVYERLEGDDMSSVVPDPILPAANISAVPGLSTSLSSLALAPSSILSPTNLTYSAAVIGNLTENPSLATTSVVNASLPTTSVVDSATATASASSQPMVEIAESTVEIRYPQYSTVPRNLSVLNENPDRPLVDQILANLDSRLHDYSIDELVPLHVRPFLTTAFKQLFLKNSSARADVDKFLSWPKTKFAKRKFLSVRRLP